MVLESDVSSAINPASIRIGIIAGEPVRMEGLRLIFDQPSEQGHPKLIPIIGPLNELLCDRSLHHIVVDLNSSAGGFEILETVRRSRPEVRQIVIGPENQDELVLNAITAGARAYLDSSAAPETVRQAIQIVVSGSIWAPRKLLSRLIDRLLGVAEATAPQEAITLTDREKQVLELILLAKSTREIAHQLGIEERTVKAHVGRLMHKTGVENRVELCVRALNRSLLHEPPTGESTQN